MKTILIWTACALAGLWTHDAWHADASMVPPITVTLGLWTLAFHMDKP